MLTQVNWLLLLDQRWCAILMDTVICRRILGGDRPLSRVLHSRHLSMLMGPRFGRRQIRLVKPFEW
jgi:hypothetical protein